MHALPRTAHSQRIKKPASLPTAFAICERKVGSTTNVVLNTMRAAKAKVADGGVAAEDRLRDDAHGHLNSRRPGERWQRPPARPIPHENRTYSSSSLHAR